MRNKFIIISSVLVLIALITSVVVYLAFPPFGIASTNEELVIVDENEIYIVEGLSIEEFLENIEPKRQQKHEYFFITSEGSAKQKDIIYSYDRLIVEEVNGEKEIIYTFFIIEESN